MSADYLDAAFEDLLDEDGLLVMARGLGKQRLIARFLRRHAEMDPGTCVLCLHMSSLADNQLLTRGLLAEGMKPEQLPRVITNDTVSADRQNLYKQGGVFLVTSRILIVDLLAERLDVSRIRGMVVNNAHRITDVSTEAFIIRVYRQRNRTGFLKAFSDEPELLLQGFGRLERVLKYCYLRRVYLWPRYHVAVKEFLCRHEPEVIEMAQALTPSMTAIQQAVLVAMDGCLKELRRTTTVDAASLELKLDNGIFRSFHTQLRRQLDPEWHTISAKTKQLVADLGGLRHLLDVLLRYDAVTFYQYLLDIQKGNLIQKCPSDWLSSEAANRMFHHAKSRAYRLREQRQRKGKGGGKEEGKEGGLKLEVILEENPKWKLLRDVLTEIQQDHEMKLALVKKKKEEREEKEKRKEKEERKEKKRKASSFSSSSPSSPLLSKHRNDDEEETEDEVDAPHPPPFSSSSSSPLPPSLL